MKCAHCSNPLTEGIIVLQKAITCPLHKNHLICAKCEVEVLDMETYKWTTKKNPYSV